MRIISWNINGLGKHFNELKQLIEAYNPDYVCIQKMRNKTGLEKFAIDGYQQLYVYNDIADWSGVIIYWKKLDGASSEMPLRIPTPKLSDKGHLQAYDCMDFILINAYAPYSNPTIEGAYAYRRQWDKMLVAFLKYLPKWKPVVICGDLNIVHTALDTHSDSYIKNVACYLDWERANFEELLSTGNLTDSFRFLHPDTRAYSFFAQSQFRKSGHGDRIDYALVSSDILPGLVNSTIIDFGSAQSLPLQLDFQLDVTAEPMHCHINASGVSLGEESSQGLDKKVSIANAGQEQTIHLKEAARWLARMAAQDGVVSPNERKLLKEFAETYGLDTNYLYRLAHANANDVEEPEVEMLNRSEHRGRQFEEFVVSLCSDRKRFTLLAWRGDKIAGDTYALENLMPDLHLRHRLDNEHEVEYHIECKYRSELVDGVLDLTSQLGRYQRMTSSKEKTELFLAIGIGGTPTKPERFYLIPSRMVKRDHVIKIENFSKCLCPQDQDGFHNYITHFFHKRVFKTKTE